MPTGILRHGNGDNSDDRIGNLGLIKKPLRIAYVQYDDGEASEYGRLTEQMSGVYEILCTANGRRYVGSAVDMDKRWRLHLTQLETRKHHSRHLQRAWDKHGEQAFIFRVIERCERESVVAREQHYIDALKPEFNSRPTAASQLGWRPTEESRAKMRESALGNTNRIGTKQSEEAKDRIRLNRKGKGCGSHCQERRRNVAKGLMNSISDLTEESIREGRRLRGEGLSAPQIAKLVGCSVWAAYDFLGGRTFGWVK
jgi:group I intron endonuclease